MTGWQVAAEDPDEGNNRKLFFFFDDEESKDFMSLFGLDPETGEMILKSPISHDGKAIPLAFTHLSSTYWLIIMCNKKQVLFHKECSDNAISIGLSALRIILSL